ncbi:hypothetical protein BDD26_1084 [Xenorhabdus cabanillasii]|uniref:DUF5710 domain-containing protein n=1 Tax=Xenorhabdus cabanillasii TaxID=351673 RepID=A0A3D9UP18_9GAMM|nr:DUF5710 domain-containing protein [Xenorhabdus cabanillasii]REF26441.1 hypothetical protein BDD26_1084 [Xenorhabdus cabanillasii]
MLRIDLNVPDDEYEKARKLGAHWDAVEQIWYIDNSIDPTPFINWLPFYNVHAEYWYLAQTQTTCPHCQGNTIATAFMLPAGHQLLEVDSNDKPDTEIDYTEQDRPAFLFYLADLPTLVRSVLPGFHHRLRKVVNQPLQRQHWINHCEHCDVQQDDTELFAEINGAFFPASKEQAAAIQLHRIDQPFVGYCEDISDHHYYFDPKGSSRACQACDWFEWMAQVVNTPSVYRH